MNKFKISIIGSFPPPYGGATIKNNILYQEILKSNNVKKIDTKKLSFKVIIQIIYSFLFIKENKIILSVSSYSLMKITKLFFKISKERMRKISVFIVGGIFPEIFLENNLDKEIYNNYSNIYVECHGMKEKLDNLGLLNVDVIPNFRARNEQNEKLKIYKKNENFKIIFLSRICENKGVFEIIEAAKILDSKNIKYKIDFYGPIDSSIDEKFKREIDYLDNVEYKGIFDSINDDIYKKINEYHVLVLPTYHKGEGMPGILVESKIAGVPSIVSNINYNGEVIKNNKNGIILKENISSELAKELINLINNEEVRNKLAENAKKDSENYIIDKYLDKILKK